MKRGCPHDLAVVYDPRSSGFKWWTFTSTGCVGCYVTKWGAMRAARRMARILRARRVEPATQPFRYGFDPHYPVAAWALPAEARA